MDCEAADILQQIQEQMVILSEDPTIKFPLYVSLFLSQHFTIFENKTELSKLTFELNINNEIAVSCCYANSTKLLLKELIGLGTQI